MQISHNNPFLTAQQGIQNGYQQLNNNSEILANPDQPDKTEALIDTKQAENTVSANLKVVKAADDRIGSLLDILA